MFGAQEDHRQDIAHGDSGSADARGSVADRTSADRVRGVTADAFHGRDPHADNRRESPMNLCVLRASVVNLSTATLRSRWICTRSASSCVFASLRLCVELFAKAPMTR